MPRSLEPWMGKTDDAAIPGRVRKRILERQRNADGVVICPDCGQPIRPGMKAEYDHHLALIDGGEHSEANLRLIHYKPCHQIKTSREATARAESRSTVASHYGIKPKSQWSTRPLGTGNKQHRATRELSPKFEGDILSLRTRKETV